MNNIFIKEYWEGELSKLNEGKKKGCKFFMIGWNGVECYKTLEEAKQASDDLINNMFANMGIIDVAPVGDYFPIEAGFLMVNNALGDC